ncbi:hypothetical protein OQX61_23885 [Pedobacter sp. PLR]|uniref:hypothetical protein n=1 Tax=Pedobacter sp. PLR TaxID=2994465 RepID=UPI00224768C3|nr:hypothetical protein [Pedobacter sp. PLR]MCX2454332.1 hypothetical protein [Pedobacter sp. PLR]
MKKNIGLTLIGLSFLAFLINHYFIENKETNNVFPFLAILFFVIGFIVIIPFELFSMYIFDPKDWAENKSIEKLVSKFRLRALLFNNVSVIILVTAIGVIITGFYFLVDPPIQKPSDVSVNITIRIGSSILLIFLVQMLFKVFKYLLRVAAFYNAKADAIELNKMKPEIELEKLMELLTPEKYDIADLQQSSISDNIVEMIKAKLGK